MASGLGARIDQLIRHPSRGERRNGDELRGYRHNNANSSPFRRWSRGVGIPLYGVRKPHSCVADAPKPAGPCNCGATQTLNDIPLYAVPEAAQLRGRRT